MLYPATRLSFGRIHTAIVSVLFLAFGAFAMQAQVAPILVPYSATTLAGNAQAVPTAGFGGDGGPSTGATLNSPEPVAVDTVGNIYFADKGNDVIREINALTGTIEIIAGITPSKCTGVLCSATPACSDGVAAVGNGSPGAVQGLVVDGYGNVYFDDSTYMGVWVIYKAGTQVANFIKLVDSAGVTKAGGVLPGYVYHIGGVAAPTTTGTGCTDQFSPVVDQTLATAATVHSPTYLGLDGAGNIYIADVSDGVERVINTQSSVQSFFGVSVQPGYMASIVDCSATLNTLTGQPLTGQVCTGLPSDMNSFGGPVNKAIIWSAPADAVGGTVDQFGNVYMTSTKGSPQIYVGVAYAGGSALAKMINVESATAIPAEINGTLTASYGNWYEVLNNVQSATVEATMPQLGSAQGAAAVLSQGNYNFPVRPSSVQIDPNGSVWFIDYHYPILLRFDPNTGIGTRIMCGYGGGYEAGDTLCANAFLTSPGITVGTTAAPVYCNTITGTPGTSGPLTSDAYGSGCPADEARYGSASGAGSEMTFDGTGNLIFTDFNIDLLRKISVNTHFPSTPVGSPAYQTLQFHFDQSNLPAMPVGYVTTTASTAVVAGTFQILPGSPDFTLSTVAPSIAAYPSPATCGNITLGQNPSATLAGTTKATQGYQLDNSLECRVNVTFNPLGPGVRTGVLQVTTASGAIYNFGLTGLGSGAQIAIDGGSQAVFATTGLGKPGQIAVAQSGTVYIADPANNRIVVEPAGGGTQTTVGAGLSAPMGVALDATGNVYIADTGNNRVVKVAAVGGAQTVLGGIAAVGVPAYPSISFKAPQGVAVDSLGNVYVADTGNARVVEISPFGYFAPAVMLQFPGAPKLVTPVGIAVDSSGNVYVADSGFSSGIIKILPGGGDLQPILGTTTLTPGASVVGFGASGITVPNGVAVDAAGDLYVSDSAGNFVTELSSSTGPGSAPFPLSFTGLSGPGGLALDPNGNVYLSDTGNKRVLLMNRTLVAANFGSVSLYAPAGTIPMNVTNIGNASLTVLPAFATIGGTNAGDFAETDACSVSATNFPTGVLGAGLHCVLTPSFTPTTGGSRSATLSAQGGLASIALSGTGIPPLATITLATTGTLAAGNTLTITATATQPNGTKATPTGTLTFSYTVDGVAGAAVPPVTLSAGGTASFNLPTLLLGRLYVVSASYGGDSLDSPSTATPLSLYVPGNPVTVSAASVTFVYGSPVPAITGTVTGLLPADVTAGLTYSFTTPAKATTDVGTYPITVVFSGANAANYGFGPFPPVYTVPNGTTPATVTETQAALTFTISNFTLPYGDFPATSPEPVGSGAWIYTTSTLANSDALATPTFTPANTSVLNVGTYTVTPTLALKVGNINDYKVTINPGTLTIVKEATTTSVTGAASVELPSAVGSGSQAIAVGPAIPTYFGTPTGTVTVTDVFTPIIAASPGVGPAVTTVLPAAALSGGKYTYVPTSTTLGTHAYYANYSGDSNFLTSFGPATTNLTCLGLASPALLGATPSQSPTSCLLVDYADFNVVASSSPMQVLPGTVPGGISSIANQSATYPQYEPVAINSIQGYTTSATNIVNVTCTTSAPSWLTCGLSLTNSATFGLSNPVSPATIGGTSQNLTLSSSTKFSGSSTFTCTSCTGLYLQVYAPLTLPVNFFSTEVRGSGTKTVLSFLPLGALVFIPLAWKSRRRFSKILWMLLALTAISVGTSACQNNSVEFYTPVPLGNQTVTVTAIGPGTGPGGTVLPCLNPTASPNDCVNRAFVVPISVQ
jgi:sugar lactone lactonase YvrE